MEITSHQVTHQLIPHTCMGYRHHDGSSTGTFKAYYNNMHIDTVATSTYIPTLLADI